jgi:hemerythrin-like metal-binding protein
MFIHWDKKFETGNALIDAEHKILVMLFKKLDIALKTKLSSETISRIVVEVKKFAEFHFVSEENLMHETNYPGLRSHMVIHSNLISELNLMISRISNHKVLPEEVLGFLNDWLVTHIGEEDQRVAKHIEMSERRPVAESEYSNYLSK